MGDGEIDVSRRSYLGIVGAASGAALLSGPALADHEYSEVIDIVEAGADNTGEEPIDEVFQEHAADDTLIEFPDGTYAVNQLNLYQLSNFGLVGTGDATLVPGEDYVEEQWIVGAETSDLTIRNFTIDTTGEGIAPEIDISAYDSLEFRDIVKRGYQDDGGVAFGLYMLSEDSRGLIQNVRAPDGGDSVGLYIQSEGPMTVRNCQFENFADNGVYASTSSAPIRVEGGLFRNNNISQVRLGSEGSVVTGAEMVIDEPLDAEWDEPVNMRGVRVADGPGPVRVEDCDITLEGGQGSGGIVDAYSGGSLVVRDTRIHVGRDYTTIGSEGSDTSFAILADDATDAEPGSRRFENVSITGAGTNHGAVLLRRDDNTLRNCCLNQSGESRDGIIFATSTDNTVADSVVDVPDEPIVVRDSSVRRSGISTSGSCPAPGEQSETSSTTVSGEMDRLTSGEMDRLVREQETIGDWASLGLDGEYESPVVVAKPLSHDGFHPCHTRLRDVTASGFDLQFEEWMYLDGDHRSETVHHLALAGGSHSADDLRADVGRVRTDHTFSSVTFDQDFEQRPVVLAQCQTREGEDPIVTRLRNVTTDGAELRVQEEEGEKYDGYHTDETVGYIALEPTVGTVADRPFEVGTAQVHEEWRRIEFEHEYDDPQFVAGIQTFEGPNTANLRYQDLTESGVDLFVEEEQSADEETLHRYERIGYAVFEGGL